MTFIVTLIALLIERFFDWSHLRKWDWYSNYQRAITKRFPDKAPNFILAVTIIPLLLLVVITQIILKHTLFGLAEFLFQLFLFLYCLGPQNLWADTFACINALVQGDMQLASDKLKATFGVTDTDSKQALHDQLLNHIFIAANRRIFAIVFWFMVLGPIGAVLYRTITLSSAAFPSQEAVPELLQNARSAEAVLDWIPVRILTCVFALGGHFVKVFSCWRKAPFSGWEGNEALLIECGWSALGGNEIDKVAEDGSAERNAIGLLDRSFVITLVVVAIIVMLN
jgi:membrane protein required for beta-lactamase induction